MRMAIGGCRKATSPKPSIDEVHALNGDRLIKPSPLLKGSLTVKIE